MFVDMHAVVFALSKYHKKHPVNYVLLVLNSLTTAVTVGYACAYVKGIEAVSNFKDTSFFCI